MIQRNKLLQTHVSEEEFKSLEKSAQDLGLTIASYLRTLAIQHSKNKEVQSQ